jgi:hypothetical protein
MAFMGENFKRFSDLIILAVMNNVFLQLKIKFNYGKSK